MAKNARLKRAAAKLQRETGLRRDEALERVRAARAAEAPLIGRFAKEAHLRGASQ